jgi:hypothetical protein
MTDEEYFMQMQKHVNWLAEELDNCFKEKLMQLPAEFRNADIAITSAELLLANVLRISIDSNEDLQAEIAELPQKLLLMMEHLLPHYDKHH